jgi:membrane-associated phospholipid phosphatase
MLAGALLALAGVAALPIDLPVARWFMQQRCYPLFVKLVSLAEVMSHGIGAAALLVTIAVLDPTRLRRLARVTAMSLGAGLLANCMKLFLARRRPYHFDFLGGPLATFGQWFPGTGGGSGAQSFLSSHAAVAAGMALGLAWLYPRGRWLFVGYGALAMAQRLVAGAHYSSDVLWGASLGLLWGAACLSPALAGRWFDTFEHAASRDRSPDRAAAATRPGAADRPAPTESHAA